MTDTPAWLGDGCLRLIGGEPSASDLVEAAALGDRAAAESLTVTDIVEAFGQAAEAGWDAVPGPEAQRQGGLLLRSLRRLTVAAIDGYHRAGHDEAGRREHDRDTFIDELLAAHPDPGRLAARAQRYGVRLSGQHTVVVARAPDLGHPAAHAIDDALAARFGAANTLTSLRDHELICIVAGGLRGVPAELARHLVQHLGAGRWQIAVGRSHRGLPGLATSLDEARNTLDLADRLGFATPVLHAADLLVFPVLLRDRDAITDLVTTVLGPLITARGGAQPLLQTLAVLFEQQGNHTATARQLHISVRAVTYRLDRIRSLTGYHPGEPTQRFTLHTAVLGARLLGWPSGA
ncbi:PucR family transcriptional regulator [Catellatospora chokoriensis]|uniref:PucR C-terminal helix-turn-helix domain-containing protein n=1 Tax=Catellatospora chokoriensis TaxID=310353 RepID=A0A8J3NV71_9ACTN|nr:helix-turn-helix domain-containing protein [Catellatospora chokoriensis]GIF93745.1 hypothetical protein Cch02nite_71890 [Catellatospora chokoriensis]